MAAALTPLKRPEIAPCVITFCKLKLKVKAKRFNNDLQKEQFKTCLNSMY
jgi:hypothetical protein